MLIGGGKPGPDDWIWLVLFAVGISIFSFAGYQAGYSRALEACEIFQAGE